MTRITRAQLEAVQGAVQDGGIEAWSTLGFRNQWVRAVRDWVHDTWRQAEADAEAVVDWGHSRRGPKPIKGPEPEIVAAHGHELTLLPFEPWRLAYSPADGAVYTMAQNPVIGLTRVLPEDGLAWYEDYALALVGVAEQELLDRAKRTVSTGIERGLAGRQIAAELGQQFESFSRFRLNNIARTECLTPGQRVFTSEGWKPIECVRPGDSVFSTRLHWDRVVKITSSLVESCKVRTICAEGHGLTTTLNHPFLALIPGRMGVWVSAEELQRGDRVWMGPARPGEDNFAVSPSLDQIGRCIHAEYSILDIEERNYSGLLYDLTTERDGSFLAEGFYIHNSGHIYNMASLSRYQADSMVSAYAYLVTQDDRTTQICLGYVDVLVSATALRDVPPLHFMCRTVLEPYFAWENPALTGYGEAEPQKGFGGLFPKGTGLRGVGPIPTVIREPITAKPARVLGKPPQVSASEWNRLQKINDESNFRDALTRTPVTEVARAAEGIKDWDAKYERAREEMEKALERLNVKLTVRVNAERKSAEAILREGRMRSAYELPVRDKSYMDFRTAVDKRLGVGKKTIFGSMGRDSEMGELLYGDVSFNLKGTVSARTSLTIADSFYSQGQFGFGFARRAQAERIIRDAARSMDSAVFRRFIEKPTENRMNAQALKWLINEDVSAQYVEAQIMGGVKLDDVSEIVVRVSPAGLRDIPPELNYLRSLAEQRGIPVRLYAPSSGRGKLLEPRG